MTLEVKQVSDYMEGIIKQIGEECRLLKDLAEARATALSNYDKELAIAVLKLKNGVIQEVDGIPVKDLAITLIKTVAKGICNKHLLDKELADNHYKACITRINAKEAQLNGFQSINRHLESL